MNGLAKFLEIDKIEIPANTHSNKASIPLHPWMLILYSDKKYIKTIRNIFMNSPIKRQLQKLVSKPPQKLDATSIKKITDLYFLKDIEQLERLLNKNLSSWK
mgnify:CR=1 FL=1